MAAPAERPEKEPYDGPLAHDPSSPSSRLGNRAHLPAGRRSAVYDPPSFPQRRSPHNVVRTDTSHHDLYLIGHSLVQPDALAPPPRSTLLPPDDRVQVPTDIAAFEALNDSVNNYQPKEFGLRSYEIE